MASLALQVPTPALHQALQHTGRNALLRLSVGGGSASDDAYQVMVRDIQRHPISGQILHVDFYRVEMTERMEAEVPIAFTGISPVVESARGTLTHSINTIRVSGLPGAIPSSVEVNVSVLGDQQQTILAKDIPLPPGVALASDPEQLVAHVVARRGAQEEDRADATEETETREERA